MEVAPGVWSFSRYDGIVLAAARARLRVLPVLYGPPAWAVRHALAPGQRGMALPDPARYAEYATRLVRRYGPSGALWSTRPVLSGHAISGWQIWNEPNHTFWWPGGPDAPAYVRLLAAARSAIRAADPNAEVVAAGIPDTTAESMFDYVGDLYRAGAGPLFDVLAIHTYAHTPAQSFALVRATRREMSAYGDDAKPLWITEAGWASGGPAGDFTVGERGQARAEMRFIRLLFSAGGSLGVQTLTMFQWRDRAPPSRSRDLWPYHAGLQRRDGRANPALSAIAAFLRRHRQG
jgi:hypothetical protein